MVGIIVGVVMGLEGMNEEDASDAANMLADYWKERGMPQYDQEWAEEYLKEGHGKEIVKDEFFVYKENGELIGILSLITDISGVAEIRDMVVRKEDRRKGYGTKMLQELIGIAKERKIRKLFSLVFPITEHMNASLGFVKEGILKSHFKEGEDLVIMSKFL